MVNGLKEEQKNRRIILVSVERLKHTPNIPRINNLRETKERK